MRNVSAFFLVSLPFQLLLTPSPTPLLQFHFVFAYVLNATSTPSITYGVSFIYAAFTRLSRLLLTYACTRAHRLRKAAHTHTHTAVFRIQRWTLSIFHLLNHSPDCCSAVWRWSNTHGCYNFYVVYSQYNRQSLFLSIPFDVWNFKLEPNLTVYFLLSCIVYTHIHWMVFKVQRAWLKNRKLVFVFWFLWKT